MNIKNCPISQQTHSDNFKKPYNIQIISNNPKERYVIDITEILEEINDNKFNYKYIFDIIDHHSKLCGSYLLESKESKEIVVSLNDFISHYGIPKIIQCDNGMEFCSSIFNEYCVEKNIAIIHSKPSHPQTNGIVERLHKDIKKSLYVEKLIKKDKYNIKIALQNSVFSHNNTICRSTKFKPIELFYSNSDEIKNKAKENIIKSQKNINNNRNPIPINAYVLVVENYIKAGKTLNVKFDKKGKKRIPGIVAGKGSGALYPIRISVNYNDLEKDNIYDVDYKLLKEINEQVYNCIIINLKEMNNSNTSYLFSDSDEDN